jgi:hypothetical protein
VTCLCLVKRSTVQGINFPAEDRWEYPPIANALTIAGLLPIKDNIQRWNSAAANYIASRPIFDLCKTPL